jgi:regulation of enolase protein 1 (concanavalin A-like superfamily)
MGKIRSLAVFLCALAAANAWATPFKDDFNRPDGNVGNGWTIQTDGTIKVKIANNEVLIEGTQATDWVRSGLSRSFSGETKVSFDFKTGSNLNFHARVDGAGNNSYIEIYCWPGGPLNYASSTDGGWPGWVEIAGATTTAGQYNHVTLELTGAGLVVSVNGKAVGTVINASLTALESLFLSSDASAGTTGTLYFDNVEIGTVIAGAAKAPTPAEGATDVGREVVLGWTAGEFAATHTVYLGTSMADVEAASASDPRGVLVSAGRAEAAFDPEGLLEFATTYYWRVDEVNAPPSSGTVKGTVWSFTTEPYAYTVTGVTAAASSSTANMGPEKTVDGSGLSGGLHSSGDTDMWLSGANLTLPAWIQYTFGRAYKLVDVTVWNSNQKVENFIGFGAKDVLAQASLDGENWVDVATVEVPRAPGTDGYAGTVFSLAGVEAKALKFVIQSNWGGFVQQTGLSEVRFTYIPVVARGPEPANGADEQSLAPVLVWRPGREAVSHKVYLSSDRQAVTDGTAFVAEVTANRYQTEGLEYGTTYYWRVDEVSEASVVRQGEVWSFSTAESFVVEDFESYNDDDNRIYIAWVDGLTTQANGSQVGYDESPFAERTIVHGGNQSMPLAYDNTKSPYYSEAEREFEDAQNWAVQGVSDLIVWFRGYPVTFVETVAGVKMSAAGADIWDMADEFRYVYKRLNGDGSITARVDSLARRDGWTKAGVMIRESLDAGAAHASIDITPDNGVSFQYRSSTANTSADVTQAGVTVPCWLRITRTGNKMKAEHSADGKTWSSVGTDAAASSKDIAMTGTVYIGLCLTSHNPSEISTVEFSNIVTAGGVTGSWETAEIGVDHPGNDADGLYVMVKDSANHTATIAHPNPAATLIPEWTEWRIPLSSIKSAGVNIASVEKLVIGVGDRKSPKAGGKGLVFIDDILVGRLGSSDPGVSGLQAYYPLENDVLDASGNGRDGTMVGTPAFIDGPVGKALEFSGDGAQRVTFGTWNPSAATGQLSLALWAKWNGLTTFYQGLIGKRDSWAANDMMWQIEANITTGVLRIQRTEAEVVGPVMPAGEWVHIAAVCDGTTGKLYLNGDVVAQGAFSFGTDPGAMMVFGDSVGGGGNPFNGALDEIYIYDRPLSPFEINYLAGIQ